MAEEYSTMSTFWFNLKRVSVDVLVLLSVMCLIFFIPTPTVENASPKLGFLSIFLSKLIFISAGILHAHITRKLMWNYINFSTEPDLARKLMIVAWYSVIIWGWARGG